MGRLLLLNRSRGGIVRAGLLAEYRMDVETRNLVLFSEAFNKSAWAASNVTVTANDGADPDGSAVADELAATAGNGTVLQTVSGLSGSHTFSVWLKRVTGSGDVDLTVDGGSTWSTVAVSSSWERFSVAGVPSSIGVRLVTSGDAVLAWGAMLTAGASVEQYTPTSNKRAVYDYSGKGNHAHLGSAGTAFINPVGGAKALNLPGTSGNYASTPDKAALDITGDIDVRAHVRLSDWSPAAEGCIASKLALGNQRSWFLRISSTGGLQFVWSTDGTTSFIVRTSTEPVPFADGSDGWVRATLDVDNGSGGHTTRFFTSTDGVSWTKLGSDVVNAGSTSIFSGSANLEVGSAEGGTQRLAEHTVFSLEVRNGIDGTLVADFNPEDAHGDVSAFVSSTTGEVWTINQSAATTNDPVWSGEGLVFDGVDDSITLPASATEAFAVEDEAFTATPTDYETGGTMSGTLSWYAGYDRDLAANEEDRVEDYASKIMAGRGITL